MNILEKSRMRTNQNSEQRSKSDTNCQPLTHPHRSISQDPNSSYRSSSSRALAFDQKKLPTPVELFEIPCEMKHGILGEVKANQMMDQHRTKTNGANLSRSSILFFQEGSATNDVSFSSKSPGHNTAGWAFDHLQHLLTGPQWPTSALMRPLALAPTSSVQKIHRTAALESIAPTTTLAMDSTNSRTVIQLDCSSALMADVTLLPRVVDTSSFVFQTSDGVPQDVHAHHVCSRWPCGLH